MSSTAQNQQGNLDRYVVIHVATTCDEHGVYVTKDSAEVIELGWILLDAKTCDEVSSKTGPLRLPRYNLLTRNLQLHRESVLVKPINTPITPLCSKCQTNRTKLRPKIYTLHYTERIFRRGNGAFANIGFLQLA